jgi:hypothetical protein
MIPPNFVLIVFVHSLDSFPIEEISKGILSFASNHSLAEFTFLILFLIDSSLTAYAI